MQALLKISHRFWVKRFAILIVMLLAFALRLHKIEHSSLWVDEGTSVAVAHYPILDILESKITIQGTSYRESHPPFYYLMLAGSHRLLGESDFSYRFISVVFSTLLLPLLFKLGQQLHSTQAGLLSLGLGAINVTFIEYAQEARMYTFILFMATFASYSILHIFKHNQPSLPIGKLLIWGFCSLLLVLTNYPIWAFTGIQTIILMWFIWRLGHKKALALIVGLGAFISAGTWLLFQPGLPYFDNQSINIPDLIRFGQTLISNSLNLATYSTSSGIPYQLKPILGWLIYLILAIGILGIHHWRNRVAILVHWLAVPFGLFLMAALTPGFEKVFHPRHLISSGAVVILLASIGISNLFNLSNRFFNKGLAVFLLGLLLLTSAGRTIAYFPDAQDGSQKDDYRLLVRTIMENAGNNDVVLFNNAARLTLYEHYSFRPDLPVTALPDYSNPTQEHTLATLETLASQYDRIWFVVGTPIIDLDNDRMVQNWLDAHTDRIERWSFFSHSTTVGMVAFSTNQWQNKACPPNFQISNNLNPITLPVIWVKTPMDAGGFSIDVQDTNGNSWTEATQAREIGCDSRPVRLPFGMPAGIYNLVESNTNGFIGKVQIEASNHWHQNFRPKINNRFTADWQNGIHLLGGIQQAGSFFPGTHFTGRIAWENQSGKTTTDSVLYKVRMLNYAGEIVAEKEGEINPNHNWADQAIVTTPLNLFAQASWLPGEYHLEWKILINNQTIKGKNRIFSPNSDWVKAGAIQIDSWPLVTDIPSDTDIIDLGALFGSAINLHGYRLRPTEEGDRYAIELIWQAKERPTTNYTVFIHLIDPESGELMTQQDREPLDWWRPTSGWRKNEVLIDSYAFDIDPGKMAVFVGLYDPITQERLPVIFNNQSQENNQLRLFPLKNN
jgi:4-amino-4-deoxy-L-arabinose transferase-like glycosyltransferase